jgi:hypothetical protein
VIRRSPIRRVSKKRYDGRPGDEYEFIFRGESYSLSGRFVNDPESEDGRRWIGTPHSNAVIRGLTARIANEQCELALVKNCWGWVPASSGHPHHVVTKQMGGARTEDRLFVAGKRMRVWVCPTCHVKATGDLEWRFVEETCVDVLESTQISRPS